MRLIDIYRDDIAGETGKHHKACRTRWHAAARRHCNLRWLTSDPLPPPSVRGWHEDPADTDSDTYPVTTIVIDGFFASFPDEELLELYRATKDRAQPKAKSKSKPEVQP